MKKINFIKTRFFSILTVSALLILTSCRPNLSIKAGTSDQAVIFFTTGFSKESANTLKSVNGGESDAPLFNKEDIIQLLKASGCIEISAALPSSREITASAKIPKLSENPLAKTGILTKRENSLTLKIGPEELSAFYELLNEDSKSYIDLMMIPALIGEKMTKAEYRDLLSSMYGPSFADEIIHGKLTINLSSPDGRKTLKEEISLGDLLTAEKALVWNLKF
ncbi:MAG: hypothetical protein K5873_11080 [Treponema sp.]|nr:hypothetical protein [Treponema sp.]